MKWLLIGFFALISLASLAQENASTQKVSRDSLTHYAKQFIGIPYKYGGSSMSGFDCSGFVHYVFSHFKINVPRSSRDYKQEGNKVEKTEANPGDVILFTGTNSSIREKISIAICIMCNYKFLILFV